MHINELILTHFRGAKSLQLNMNKRLNVFVGMNGAGKSSVLDAAVILLSWLANRIKQENASGRPITEQDIQNGTSNAVVGLSLHYGTTIYEWRLSKHRKGKSTQSRRSSLHQASELARYFQDQIESNNYKVNLPVMAYYPVNRGVLDIPLRIRNRHQFDLLATYDESLTSGANFRTFFEWFRDREDLENENRKYQNQLPNMDNYQVPDLQLQAVRDALTAFMPEFNDLTVRRSPLRMEVQKNGKSLTVNQLSDGEKCLMAMVGDLARRFAIANPNSNNPLEGSGVILIDEIELHLHPKWQRMVIPNLSKVFPNCQFLISTHSPHVITHVTKDNLFLLEMTGEGLEVCRPSESYGKTVERILEDLMGLETTRPNQVSTKIKQVYEQISRGSLDNAKVLIKNLINEIGNDPDLTKANVLIKRKEIIGK